MSCKQTNGQLLPAHVQQFSSPALLRPFHEGLGVLAVFASLPALYVFPLHLVPDYSLDHTVRARVQQMENKHFSEISHSSLPLSEVTSHKQVPLWHSPCPEQLSAQLPFHAIMPNLTSSDSGFCVVNFIIFSILLAAPHHVSSVTRNTISTPINLCDYLSYSGTIIFLGVGNG